MTFHRTVTGTSSSTFSMTHSLAVQTENANKPPILASPALAPAKLRFELRFGFRVGALGARELGFLEGDRCGGLGSRCELVRELVVDVVAVLGQKDDSRARRFLHGHARRSLDVEHVVLAFAMGFGGGDGRRQIARLGSGGRSAGAGRRGGGRSPKRVELARRPGADWGRRAARSLGRSLRRCVRSTASREPKRRAQMRSRCLMSRRTYHHFASGKLAVGRQTVDKELRRNICRLIAGLVVADDDLEPAEDAFVDKMLAKFEFQRTSATPSFPSWIAARRRK